MAKTIVDSATLENNGLMNKINGKCPVVRIVKKSGEIRTLRIIKDGVVQEVHDKKHEELPKKLMDKTVAKTNGQKVRITLLKNREQINGAWQWLVEIFNGSQLSGSKIVVSKTRPQI